MLQNFKVPFFTNITDFESLKFYLETLLSRWSPSDLIKFSTIQINEWDMDSTDTVTITFGDDIKLDRITNIWVMINNDDLDKRYSGNLVGNEISVDEITQSGVTIRRLSGGFFDSADFDDTTISRGEVTICYLT